MAPEEDSLNEAHGGGLRETVGKHVRGTQVSDRAGTKRVSIISTKG